MGFSIWFQRLIYAVAGYVCYDNGVDSLPIICHSLHHVPLLTITNYY